MQHVQDNPPSVAIEMDRTEDIKSAVRKKAVVSVSQFSDGSSTSISDMGPRSTSLSVLHSTRHSIADPVPRLRKVSLPIGDILCSILTKMTFSHSVANSTYLLS